jgi:hypothetical protein
MVFNVLQNWLKQKRPQSFKPSSFKKLNAAAPAQQEDECKKMSSELSNLSGSNTGTQNKPLDGAPLSSDLEQSLDHNDESYHSASALYNIQVIDPETASKPASSSRIKKTKTKASIIDLKQYMPSEKTAIGIQNMSNLVQVARSSREIGTTGSRSNSSS